LNAQPISSSSVADTAKPTDHDSNHKAEEPGGGDGNPRAGVEITLSPAAVTLNADASPECGSRLCAKSFGLREQSHAFDFLVEMPTTISAMAE
jgi:hypothetical protein